MNGCDVLGKNGKNKKVKKQPVRSVDILVRVIDDNTGSEIVTTEDGEEIPEHDFSEAPLYDPQWKYDDLPELAKRMLTLEIANPGIKISKLMKLMNYQGSKNTFYTARKNPIYRRLLFDARKNEHEIAQEMQIEAMKKLRTLIRSEKSTVALKAIDIATRYHSRLAMKKAELQLMREASTAAINTPIRHIVEFRASESMPQIGKNVMTQDGKFVPIESTEGKAVIEASYREIKDDAVVSDEPVKSVEIELKGYDAPGTIEEKKDDGVIGGIIDDD